MRGRPLRRTNWLSALVLVILGLVPLSASAANLRTGKPVAPIVPVFSVLARLR
jgi:hypothetical protein